MRILLLLSLALSLAGCRPEQDPLPVVRKGGGVFVVNYPLEFCAQRIAGDLVPIHFPVPPDVDPAFWMPSDEEIADLQAADLVLLNGASYEKWLERISLPSDRLVDTSKSFAASYLELPVTVTHSHGEAGAHSHAGTDFNTWLDPLQLAAQARAVLDALTEFAPEHGAVFTANAAALFEDLAALDEAFGELGLELDDLGERALLASHPVYGYLARRYEWNLRAVLWEPDEMPPAPAWGKLAHLLEFQLAQWMIYEDQPLDQIRDRLREDHGVEIVVLRPCGNRPPEGDYLTEMRAGIERLRPIFEP